MVDLRVFQAILSGKSVPETCSSLNLFECAGGKNTFLSRRKAGSRSPFGTVVGTVERVICVEQNYWRTGGLSSRKMIFHVKKGYFKRFCVGYLLCAG